MNQLIHNSGLGLLSTCSSTRARGDRAQPGRGRVRVFDEAPRGCLKGTVLRYRQDEGYALSTFAPTPPDKDCTVVFPSRAEDHGKTVTDACSSKSRAPHRHHAGVSGPKFFHAEMLSEEEVIEESFPSVEPVKAPMDPAEGLRRRCEDCSQENAQIRVATWNLAGVSSKSIESTFAHVIDCDVIAVQEFPKQEAWWKVITGEKFHGVTYQNYFMYRGVGVLCRSDQFHLLKKSSVARGVWVQLRHVRAQQQLCVGSVHLPNNESKDELARLLAELLGARPKGAQAAMVLGDFNVQFVWREDDNGVVPGTISPKWAALRQGMMQAGLQQAVPSASQMHVATFHSRKGTVLYGRDGLANTHPGGQQTRSGIRPRQG